MSNHEEYNPCGPGLFHCGANLCISQSLVCDRNKDCPGYNPWDEKHCYESCTGPGYRKCSNGACVPREYFCNGHRDCPDGSDEGIWAGCGGFYRDLVIGTVVATVIVAVCLAFYIIITRRRQRCKLTSVRDLVAAEAQKQSPHQETSHKGLDKCHEGGSHGDLWSGTDHIRTVDEDDDDFDDADDAAAPLLNRPPKIKVKKLNKLV